jgi:ABC-2 type transport system permease protein
MTTIPALGRDAGPTGYRLPQLTVAEFATRRIAPAATVWGVVFGLYVYDNAYAFRSIAPTAAARDRLLATMASNPGLKALLGDTRGISTLAGFTDWRAIGVTALVASVWGLLTSTKVLRGEESAGRWELLLSGQTTSGRATASVLGGLAAGLLAMFVPTALATVLIGARHDVNFSTSGSLFMAAAITAAAAMFAAIGALASQVMPTRVRATGLAAAAFGLAFTLRALGDSATATHWLVYLSPLGWIEQLRPLADPQPLWLLPIATLIVGCSALSVYLAGRRDLGEGVLADKTTAGDRLALLRSPTLLAVRLSWASTVSWIAAAAVLGALYGSWAKSAGQAFASSPLMRKFAGSLAHIAQRQVQLAAARVYAGFIFLILMTLIMAYVASAVSKMREDEAEGYLDNLFVRSVGRPHWLCGRAGLTVLTAVIAAVLGGIGFWAGAARQHAGLSLHELMLAGINSAAPGMLLLGIGLLVLGFAPRFTSIACWAVLAWAFLVDMLGSAIKLNHWIMDTSLLQHVALAPAVSTNWRIVATYLALGCLATAAGGWRLARRDLQNG